MEFYQPFFAILTLKQRKTTFLIIPCKHVRQYPTTITSVKNKVRLVTGAISIFKKQIVKKKKRNL